MDLEDLIVRTRQIIKSDVQDITDIGSPSVAELTKLINESRNRDFTRLSISYPRRLVTQGTMTYTANAESVALLSAAQKRIVTIAQYLPQGSASTITRVDLEPKNLDEFDLYEANGEPEVFSVNMVTGHIHVRPVPQVNTTLYIYYVAALTELSNLSDIPSEWPTEFHHMHAYGAAASYLQEANDEPAYAGAMMLKHDAIFDDLKEYVAAAYPDVGVKRKARRY
jgi:hypothetical protein